MHHYVEAIQKRGVVRVKKPLLLLFNPRLISFKKDYSWMVQVTLELGINPKKVFLLANFPGKLTANSLKTFKRKKFFIPPNSKTLVPTQG